MRVLPLENEAVNECWLSDKDRFSYEGLNSDERLTRADGQAGRRVEEVDWQMALEFVARGLQDVVAKHGAAALGALASPHSTLEELYSPRSSCAGSAAATSISACARRDFRGDGQRAGMPWLGMPIAELDALDRVLVVGSFLRKDHPLLAQRLRQAAKKGAQITLLHSVDDDC